MIFMFLKFSILYQTVTELKSLVIQVLQQIEMYEPLHFFNKMTNLIFALTTN